MHKSELLGEMSSARWRWELVVARVGDQRFTEPSMHGGWSVKDTMGHVAYYERWLLNWLEDAVRGKVTYATHRDSLNVDERNALIYVENKDRPLQVIQDDARQVFERLYQLVRTLPEADLVEPFRYERYVVPLWGRSLALWECIADDSYDHYAEHTSSIRKWLEATNVELVPV
jgi:Protein of unknown function (DUF1706)